MGRGRDVSSTESYAIDACLARYEKGATSREDWKTSNIYMLARLRLTDPKTSGATQALSF